MSDRQRGAPDTVVTLRPPAGARLAVTLRPPAGVLRLETPPAEATAPKVPPSPRALGRTPRSGPGRHVCGDHRATGSVRGTPAPAAAGVPGGASAERRAR